MPEQATTSAATTRADARALSRILAIETGRGVRIGYLHSDAGWIAAVESGYDDHPIVVDPAPLGGFFAYVWGADQPAERYTADMPGVRAVVDELAHWVAWRMERMGGFEGPAEWTHAPGDPGT
ncbi:hypothetical protein CcI49_03220 [Frankia sp. CcI49]|uniref:hypothetical protein n=1 Tax=Frankia sp. CcI49 TaxID=1745382 RepID=UPI0009769AD6|nr:hypothetical protein [Frankia sp. CcI49]ONH62404.1 hypothetical protein CcI49_03220 [Frankia sp. CcI49]